MMRAVLVLLLAAATPALAAAPAPSSSLMSKHDANAPINISADKFVADNSAKTGTWTGNVVVIQSDMRMRANSVRLNVVGKESKPDKIFASGNVVVDSPNSGTVTGDDGVYDVVAHTVTMTGKQVVLTKQKDVMRGTMLTVNLDTGKAVLGAGKAPGQPNAPESAQTGGRVQGIFTPPPSSNPPANKTPK
ncbi:MAG TPA: LptA/OstA family protein [Rhizomicrobium sp.]|jgi:lipopolysaccharide export system protein LptA|nr:LptA/OstA family protein [Rhizomicrobium sp.]